MRSAVLTILLVAMFVPVAPVWGQANDQSPAGGERPNFLFILTDDQRFDAVGAMGNKLIHTPHLDALARRGMLFRKTFVTLSICAPSRAAILTGRYGSANGVDGFGPSARLRPEEKTFADRLGEAGYITGMVGKWHLPRDPSAIQRHYRDYYAAITEMDAALGRLLTRLERLGLKDSTYVIFTSDNGWLMGDFGFTSKVLAYKPSIRVPCAIAGPGVVQGSTERFALNVDLAPTLLELAGLPRPDSMHGRSLVPFLRGKEPNWRKSFLYEVPQQELGVRPQHALRTERWKYIATYAGEAMEEVVHEELYHLARDPAETTNLADSSAHQDVRKRLHKRIQQKRQFFQP